MSKRHLTLLLVAITLSACKSRPADPPPAEPVPGAAPKTAQPAKARTAPPKPKSAKARPPEPAPLLPGRAARRLTSIKVKAVTYLPLPRRLEHHALQARISRPEWSAEGAAEAAAMDGDLLSGWTCTPTANRPCALGLSLPRRARIHGLRLFGGSGVSRKAHRATARPAGVRIHTAGGWVEGKLVDRWDYQHLLLDPPLETAALVLEVRSLHGRGALTVAELDLVGDGAPPRPALKLDPRRHVTRTDAAFWGGGDPARASAAWLEQLDDQGRPRRLMRGVAAHGNSGDRFWLVQRHASCSCPGAYTVLSSRFALLDTRTRLFYAVRLQVGIGSQVLRHRAGQGFATSGYSMGDDQQVARALLLQKDGATTIRVAIDAKSDRLDKTLAGWGFPKPRRDVLPPGCRAARGAELQPLARLKWQEKMPTRGWVVCPDSSGHRVIWRSSMCDQGYTVAVLSAAGKLLHSRQGSEMTLAVARVLPGGRVLISIERKDGDAGDLYLISAAGKLSRTVTNALLRVGFPSGCRCSA